jgi:hypothetical protein
MKHSFRIAHKHAWKRWGVLPLLLSIALTFLIVASVSAAVAITATKTYTIIGDDGDGKADPGEIIEYSVAITNGGSTDAPNVVFNDTIDANTTLVGGSIKVSPLASNDSYTAIGNVSISPPASSGVLPNDYLGLNPTATITAYDATSAQGGNVVVNADGSFTYNPPAGFEGADTFTYTLSNSTGSNIGTVNIAVGGIIWFVNASAGAGGDGRLSSPFNCYTGVSCFSAVAADDPGDNIFLYSGAYTGGNTLLANQRLIGQGAGASLSAITGLTPPLSSAALPTTGGARPAITTTAAATSAITVGSGNTLRGFNIGNTTDTDITGTAFGTLTILDVELNGTGRLLNLTNGSITATFDNLLATSAPGGSGLSLTNVAGTFSVSGITSIAGAGTQGIAVSGSSVAGNFGISTTIGSTTQGILVGTSTGNIAFGNTSITAGTDGVSLQNNSAGTRSFGTLTTTNGSGIGFVHAVAGGAVTVAGQATFTNTGGRCIDIQNSTTAVTFTNVIATQCGGTGVFLNSNSGTVTFADLDISPDSGQRGLHATLNTGTLSSASGTINTTTGIAVEIVGTSSASRTPLNLQFDSLSANGSSTVTSGLVLTNTSATGIPGGFRVSGSGSTDGSGGTIQNTTTRGANINSAATVVLKNMNFTNANNSTDAGGAGGCDDLNISACNAAIYLNIVTGATLDNLNITGTMVENGITALGVSDFKLDNSVLDGCGNEVNESCVEAQNLSGTSTVNNTEIRFSETNSFDVVNSDVSWNLTINGSTFRDTQTVSSGGAASINGEGGFQFRSFSSAAGTPTTTINILNSSFLRLRTQGIQAIAEDDTTLNIDINNSTIDSQTDIGTGIDLNSNDTAKLNFNITGNPTIQSRGGSAVNITSFLNSDTEGRVNSNADIEVLGGAGIPVRLVAQETSRMIVEINGNTISNVNGTEDTAIDVQSRFQTARLDATITNNIITGETVGVAGINLISGSSTAGESTITCGDVASNNVANAAGNSTRALRIRVSDLSNTNRMLLEGFVEAGTALQDTEATWNTRSNTPVSAAGSEVAASLTGTAVGPLAPVGGVCNTVDIASDFAMAPSSSQSLAQYPAEDNRMAASFASNSDSNAASAFAPAYDLGSMYQPATWVMPNEQAANPAAALIASDSADRKAGLFAPPATPALSGETVNVPIGTLPAGKSATIKFRVTVNNPLPDGTTRILNQSTVSGSNFSNVTTTDPAPSIDLACTAAPAIGTQTCTPVDLPDTTVASINRQTPLGANTNAVAVTWRVTFADAISGLTSSNFTLLAGGSLAGTSITSVTPVSGAPATQWDVLVNTGTGDGLLELNMTSGTGLSHDIINLPFTSGEDHTIDRTAPAVTSIRRQSPASNPTNADVLVFRITFNEAVTGVGANSFITSGTTTTINAAGVSSITPNLVFDFPVDGTLNGDLANLSGTVGLNVRATPAITDLAGNALVAAEPALASNDETYTLDNTPPAAPVVVTPANGSSTNDSTPTVTGTAEAGSTVTVIFDGASAGITTADGIGNWTFTAIPSLIDGSHTVKATAADALGNTSVDSNTNTFTVDTLPPPAPVVLTPANGSTTNDTTPTVAGTAEVNSTVTIFFDGTPVGTTIADASGSWTFTPVAALSAGIHMVKSRTTDAAGNTSVDSNTNTFTVDITAPMVTIKQAASQADPTSSGPINFTVAFNEPVTGFATGDVTLAGTAGATTATVTEIVPNDGTTYSVAVSGMTADGTVIASIPAGVAQDAATNTNVASTSTDNTVTYDTIAPSVTINQAAGQADPTNISPISFDVIFSEPVTGFSDADVSLSGTAGATTAIVTETAPNNGTTYTVAVSGMATNGTVIASIPAAAAQDVVGNDNTTSTSTDNTVLYDTTVPTVTINQAFGQFDPANTSPINFNVVFSEPVSGFATGDVTLAGTAGATTATVTEIAPNDGTTFMVAVSGMTGDGTVIASMLSSVAQDAAGNGNTASTSTDNTVLYDATAPTVTINQAAGQTDPTSTSPINFTVVFNEPVTGFATGDATLAGTAGATTATVTEIAPNDGTTFTVAVNGMPANGTVIASILSNVAQDAAGNDNTASTSIDNTVIFDAAMPTVAISSAAPEPTSTSPILVTVQFSEPVSGFDIGDIVAGNGTVGNFVAVDGDTYTLDLTPIGQGLVTTDIAAAVAQDAAGNDNTAATQFIRTFDTIVPTVAIDQAAGQADPTNASPVNFVAVFSEPVTSFDGPDVSLSGTASATTASVTEIAPNDGTTYSVAVSGMTTTGTVIASIPVGAAQDTAANGNTASTSTDNTVTFDPVFPVVTGIVRADANPTNAASVDFTVTFAKSVSGVDATDFTFTSNGVTGVTISSITGSGTTWTVTVSTGTGDGTLRMDLVDDDTIIDTTNNPLGDKGIGNGNFTGEIYTIDKTAPTVVSIVRANASPTNAATVDFTITFTEIVTGVGMGDFNLATTGVSGAAITSVAGSTTWTATVNTGSGSGTIGINLVDNDTILDLVGNPLGGTGMGNGNFTGEVYTIDKTVPQAGNLLATDIITGSGLAQTFTIVFSDNLAIDIASLDGSDIRVTGPGGFNLPATLVSVTPTSSGTPRTATYQISAPSGAWDNADNGTYTVVIQANQVNDTAGNAVAAGALGTFSVDISVTRRLIYLPLVLYSASQAPDLVVSSVTINPNKTSFTTSESVQISVVIKNQGNAPTTPFWVDLYLNPSRTPALNLIWSQVCSLKPCYGMAWQVSQPLAPGAELTLISTTSSYAANYTNWGDRLAAGTTDLYVQADSWNPGKAIGASGDSNLANNLFQINGLRVTGQNAASAGVDIAPPARPAAGQR